ncbi:MAG: hypothetical protein ACI9TY_001775 [Alphaproteobacteria bacterium]|jgi:hypothetical protein
MSTQKKHNAAPRPYIKHLWLCAIANLTILLIIIAGLATEVSALQNYNIYLFIASIIIWVSMDMLCNKSRKIRLQQGYKKCIAALSTKEIIPSAITLISFIINLCLTIYIYNI